MKKIIALLLVISFLGMNCVTYERGEGINLSPDQKPGVKLAIQKTDGQQVRGELIAVKEESLLLKESKSGVDVSADIRNLQVIIINAKSKALLGAGLGFLIAGSIGVAIGLAIGDTEQSSSTFMGTPFWDTAEFKALLIGSLAGALGAIIGGLVGVGPGESIIQIEGKSEADIKKILEELRKKARVTNFQ